MQIVNLDFPIHNPGIQVIEQSPGILHPFTVFPHLQFPGCFPTQENTAEVCPANRAVHPNPWKCIHTLTYATECYSRTRAKPFLPSKLSRKTELDLNNSLKKYMKTHCKGVQLRMHSGGFFLLKAYISFNIDQQSHSNSGRGSTDCTRTLIFLPSHWVCRCFSGRRGLQTVHRCYNQSTGLEDDWKKFQSSY